MAKKQLVGLVAPFNAPNYGTVLQAFALQSVLKNQEINTEYIKYTTCVASSFRYKVSEFKNFLLLCLHRPSMKQAMNIDDYSFYITNEFKEIKNGFDMFIRKYIIYSKRTYNPESIAKCKRYVAFIVGSDQTWSESMNMDKNRLFFLKQISDDYPKYSYAPSIGSTHIDEIYLNYIIKNISSFRLLSCRERTNCRILSEALEKKVEYVVDPTLLLLPSYWNTIAANHMLNKDSYILCYILGEKDMIAEFAEKLGNEKGLPVYYIVTRPKYFKMTNKLMPSPEQFIALIRDASYLVTDSFHGTIFSINFSKNFYSFSKREKINSFQNDNDRIMEILEEFGLANRYKDNTNLSFEEDIDYSQIQQHLSMLRTSSLCYIKKLSNDILEKYE